MKKLIYVALTAALFVSGLVSAATPAASLAIASWTAPTTYTDNTTLPANQLAQYTLSYGNVSGGPYPNTINVLPVNGVIPTTITITGLTVGTWYFIVTATSTNGMTSANSNEASKTIISSAAPNPPTILTIK
jgi:hypothetical protein